MCNLHKENTDIGVTFPVSNTASQIRLISLIQRAPRRPLSRRASGSGNLIARTGKARDRGRRGADSGLRVYPPSNCRTVRKGEGGCHIREKSRDLRLSIITNYHIPCTAFVGEASLQCRLPPSPGNASRRCLPEVCRRREIHHLQTIG